MATDQRMQWWREARFGMFIHWGIYAQIAGEYKGYKNGGSEWIMNQLKIPVAEYKAYAKEFNPVNYNPDSWVKMAKDAGMKYIIITAKHHDGFALFDSKASDWDIMDATPYKKDVLTPLAAACKKYNVKLGLYYSQAQDWVNPGGAAKRRVMKQIPNPDSTAINAFTAAHNGHWDPAQTTATMSEYIDKVAVPQVKELLTNYGEVAVLWWDTPTDMTDEYAQKIYDLLKLQPNIITNDRLRDRLHNPKFPGDTRTPEQKIPTRAELDGKDWETCMTMSSTWGYKANDTHWRSSETLIRNLVDIASKGGNYLLNIGPKPDGTFPWESIERLSDMGKWMKVNGEAIYATKADPLKPLAWGRCTKKETDKGTILYLSVFDWPADGKLVVPDLKNEVTACTLLANGTKLKTSFSQENLTIEVPASAPDKIASVIKLVVKGKVGDQAAAEPKKAMPTGALD